METRLSPLRGSVPITRCGRTVIRKYLLPVLLAAGTLSAAGAAAQAAVPAPEGRTYERVSPGNKGVAAVESIGHSADTGGGVTYLMLGTTQEPRAFSVHATFFASRTATNWADTLIEPALSVGASGSDTRKWILRVSDDASQALVITSLPLESRDRDQQDDVYVIDIATGAAKMISASPAGDDANAPTPTVGGASGDLRRIVFSMPAPLTPDAPLGGGVYEWHDGSLRLLSRLPDGTAASDANLPADITMRAGTDATHAEGPAAENGGSHAIANSAEAVFWQVSPSASVRRLFASFPGAPTVAYTTSQRTIAGGVAAGTQPIDTSFIAATPDASAVYFSSASMLTDAATPGGGLYRYTFADGSLQLLTPASAGGTRVVISGGGAARASADGSHVYFVTNQRLTPDAVSTANAYVWSAVHGTHLIASFGGGTAFTQVFAVSRDGGYAVFSSTRSVAGANNAGFMMLYRYDDSAVSLRCASCRASGAASGANTDRSGNGRSIGDDGTVYFTTSDRLVDADINGKNDAYGFDGERQFLISSGIGGGGSYGDNTDDGSNVFFLTIDNLIEDDVDGLADVYTAHRGHGFPKQTPADPPVRCSGVDCASPVPPAPDFSTWQSELLDGTGNVHEPPAKPAIKPSIKVGRLNSAAKKQLARSGRASLMVRSTTAARVTATASVRVGSRWTRAGRVVRVFDRAGRATLRLSLSTKARSQLAARRTLRVRVEVRSSRTSGSRAQQFVLRSTANGGSGR